MRSGQDKTPVKIMYDLIFVKDVIGKQKKVSTAQDANFCFALNVQK